MASPIRLQTIIPFHQPINVSDADLEVAIERCYAPLIDAIAARSRARVSLHFTGHLLDYLAGRRHRLLGKLKELTGASQIEILGGLFHGGIPALLPEMDIRGQVEMMGGYWEAWVGNSPKGTWFPEMAWCDELPRLLIDSELQYGFAPASLLTPPPREGTGLGVLERGDAYIGLFAVDEPLSRGLLTDDVDGWIEALIDRAGAGVVSRPRVVTVTVRAESLGLEPGTHERCWEEGWVAAWLDAISGGRDEIKGILPASAFKEIRPAAPVALRCECELNNWDRGERPFAWPEYARRYPEAGVLYRRMLQVSDKLRDFIAAMEDEELEDDWSDSLATAQRLLFAAQCPDAYWHGRVTGFVDPSLREAVMAQLIHAANMLDELVQGDDDWIAAEEEDRDRDLLDEIVVSTARLSAWLLPHLGGTVRALDNRRAERTLLDVAVHHHRRGEEPVPPSMTAMAEDATVIDLPSDGDAPAAAQTLVPGTGIATWVLEGDSQLEELAGGSAVNLVPVDARWEIEENAIDEEGDCSFRLHLTSELALVGSGARTVALKKRLEIPIDAARLEIDYEAELTGDQEILVATEIPPRLTGPIESLELNGVARPLAREELADATSIRLTAAGPAGEPETVELRASEPLDVWCIPVGDAGSNGVLLVPLLRLESTARLRLVLDLEASDSDELEEAASEASDVEDGQSAETDDAAYDDTEDEEEEADAGDEEEDGEADPDVDDADDEEAEADDEFDAGFAEEVDEAEEEESGDEEDRE